MLPVSRCSEAPARPVPPLPLECPRSPASPHRRLQGGAQRLVQIGDQVIVVLEPDRQPDEVGRDAGRDLLLRLQLGMGCGCGMNDQRFGIADIRKMRQQFDIINKSIKPK